MVVYTEKKYLEESYMMQDEQFASIKSKLQTFQEGIYSRSVFLFLFFFYYVALQVRIMQKVLHG